MTVWRYKAVPLQGASSNSAQHGELSGDNAAEVRASLRRIGLQVIDLRPLKRMRDETDSGSKSTWLVELRSSLTSSLNSYLRRRRQHERAELYDSLATMLESGMPLLDVVGTLADSTTRNRSPIRSMLISVRERLRDGSSLGNAVSNHQSWFDASEVAMVQAAQVSGTLPSVLRTLSQRHERSGEIGNKLIAALAYPLIVAMVGLGVVIFLSVKTLPDLTSILIDAEIEVPTLTARVMAFGQFIAGHWITILLVLFISALAIPITAASLSKHNVQLHPRFRMLYPTVFRRIAVARVALQLAELQRSGVPMVEALRVIAPTCAPGSSLQRVLFTAADHVQRGDDLAEALNDELWFDAQFRSLLKVGQASGELDQLLQRIGERYSRQANRLIDRLAALLEPCVILSLAVFVGMVVMAAILPLLRLQEVL